MKGVEVFLLYDEMLWVFFLFFLERWRFFSRFVRFFLILFFFGEIE